MKYKLFKPETKTVMQKTIFAKLTKDWGISYIREPKISIYQTKHTINLLFFNILFAKSEVQQQFNNRLNYYTIISIVLGYKSEFIKQIDYRINKHQLKRFAILMKKSVRFLPRQKSLVFTEKIDYAIQYLSNLLYYKF